MQSGLEIPGGMVAPSRPINLIGKKKLNILHTKSEMLDSIDNEVINLAGRMLATCRVQRGLAIAAVQVGVPINLLVFRDGSAFVNVEIEPLSEDMEEGFEACLSLPGKTFCVPRYTEIQVSAVTILGQYAEAVETGDQARMWQHENDHLLGKLLSDDYKPVRA